MKWSFGRAAPGALALMVTVGVIVLMTGCTDQNRPQSAEQTQITENPQTTPTEETTMTETVAGGQIVAVSEADFEAEVLQAQVPVLVDFYADWCGPCRMLHPILEKIAARYAGKAKIAQVNVDANPALANRYGIRSIPALFLIKDGQVVDQALGLQTEAQLQAMLDKTIGG